MEKDIYINAEGGWQPKKKIEFDPIFVWPPRPVAFFKWLLNFPGYIWPWNLFYIALAIICYLFFQPELSRCNIFKFDWISIIFLRNLFLIVVLAGFWHLRLHILKSQNDEFQYNPHLSMDIISAMGYHLFYHHLHQTIYQEGFDFELQYF